LRLLEGECGPRRPLPTLLAAKIAWKPAQSSLTAPATGAVQRFPRSAAEIVLMTPERKKAERNTATVPFMKAVRAIFDDAARRETQRRPKWRGFFQAFYGALPLLTRQMLVSEEAALKQLSRAKVPRTR
jgi:hypothetical protein